MTYYFKHFAAVYSIALVVFITAITVGLNLGGLSFIAALIASALISAGHFVKKQQRLPTAAEKTQLIWGLSTLAIVIASFFILFIVLMSPNVEEILQAAEKAGIGLTAVIMLFLIIIHALIFHLAYTYYAKNRFKKIEIS